MPPRASERVSRVAGVPVADVEPLGAVVVDVGLEQLATRLIRSIPVERRFPVRMRDEFALMPHPQGNRNARQPTPPHTLAPARKGLDGLSAPLQRLVVGPPRFHGRTSVGVGRGKLR
jgi:hypothetical protein